MDKKTTRIGFPILVFIGLTPLKPLDET